VSSKLGEELRWFHNPTAEKTRKLFLDYLEVDVTAGWKWLHHDPASARKTLDDLLGKRGDAVHRSRPMIPGTPPAPHLLKRDDLEKAIRFLRGLVEATDRAIDCRTARACKSTWHRQPCGPAIGAVGGIRGSPALATGSGRAPPSNENGQGNGLGPSHSKRVTCSSTGRLSDRGDQLPQNRGSRRSH
jgi:hypothetical protein